MVVFVAVVAVVAVVVVVEIARSLGGDRMEVEEEEERGKRDAIGDCTND